MAASLIFWGLVIYGLYRLFKYLETPIGFRPKELREREEISKKYDQEQALVSSWINKVTNAPLERELEELLFQRDEKLVKEVESTWGEYFVTEYPGLMIKNSTSSSLAGNGLRCVTELDALRILMANRGFLTCSDARFGIPVSAYGETQKRKMDDILAQLHFVQAINKHLKRQRDLNENLYLEAGGSSYRSIETVLNGVANGAIYVSGKVRWGSSIRPSSLEKNRIF